MPSRSPLSSLAAPRRRRLHHSCSTPDEVESAAAADEGVYDVKLTDSLASKDDETQPPAKDDGDETQLDSARVSPAAGPAAKKRRRAAAEDHPSFTFSGIPCCSQDSQKSAMSDDPAWW